MWAWPGPPDALRPWARHSASSEASLPQPMLTQEAVLRTEMVYCVYVWEGGIDDIEQASVPSLCGCLMEAPTLSNSKDNGHMFQS